MTFCLTLLNFGSFPSVLVSSSDCYSLRRAYHTPIGRQAVGGMGVDVGCQERLEVMSESFAREWVDTP